MTSATTAARERRAGGRALGLTLCLLGLVGAAYGGAGQLGFVELDDPLYVTSNPHVVAGLDASTARWALGAFDAANWHPLTWLSLSLDARLFGLAPAAFHGVNVGLHAASVLALFWLLTRLTRAWAPSFVAAALLAVHPVHVESVAWVSARKDVGFLLWGLLATLAYVRLCERRSVARWLVVAATLAASLMSKPAAVVWPLLWLLVDAWPLGRLAAIAARDGTWRAARGLVVEKLPFLAMSLGAGGLTVLAQAQGGAVRTLDEVGLAARLGNAAASYAAYLGKLAWPAHLACFYPREVLAWWQVTGALALLAAVTGLAWARRRPAPWLAFGWAWFVTALVPAIGLVQVGRQAMADRYAYLPAVGIYVTVAFGAWTWATTPRRRQAVGVAVALVLAVLVPLTRAQVATWRDGVTLAAHALAVTGPNPVALRQLAAGRLAAGDVDGAVAAIAAAADLAPGDLDLPLQLTRVLVEHGRAVEAVAALERACTRNDDPTLALTLAELLARGGDRDRGLAVLRQTLARLPADDARLPRVRSVMTRLEGLPSTPR